MISSKSKTSRRVTWAKMSALTGVTLVLVALLAVAGCSTTADTAPADSSSSSAAAATGAPAGGMGMPGGGGDKGSVQPKYADVAYASKSSAEQLDIYLPKSGAGPFPVILSIHGGAFSMGDKADGQQIPMLAGLGRGYAVVSVNYRLSGEARFPAAVNDVKASVRFLRANAAKYRLDTNRIVAWGGSAGGNLAAMLGTSGGVAALSDPSLGNRSQSDKVQAVVDWFGPIAFLQMDPELRASGDGPANHDEASSPESQYLGAALPTVPGKVKAADPTTYCSAGDPPFFIEHGDADGNVPVQQSRNFASALTKVLGAGNVRLRIIPGAGHMDPAFDTPANLRLVFNWLDGQFRN